MTERVIRIEIEKPARKCCFVIYIKNDSTSIIIVNNNCCIEKTYSVVNINFHSKL